MKRLFTLVALCMLSVATFAQKDVTKFLGIPVDGTKTQMIQKLKAKGFTYNQQKDILKGEFNGEQVEIKVQTQGNKVWRLAISDVIGRDEGQIKIRYNKLISQFKNNENYIVIYENEPLSEDEDIEHNILAYNKQYEASFYQTPNIDSTQYRQMLQTKYANEIKRISEYEAQFSEEELANPQGELKENMEKISEWALEIEQIEMKEILNNAYKKLVWFTIGDIYGRYYITMFYENGYNEADGSDL
jgi:hypothetical protein